MRDDILINYSSDIYDKRAEIVAACFPATLLSKEFKQSVSSLAKDSVAKRVFGQRMIHVTACNLSNVSCPDTLDWKLFHFERYYVKAIL